MYTSLIWAQIRIMETIHKSYTFEIGIKGNTHFPFSDLNNIQIADLMSDWLKEKGLDK